MSMPPPGTFVWTDLTVPNADEVSDFYTQVVGWTDVPVAMEGYADHALCPPGSTQPATGVCHARGPNEGLPAQWLVYVSVADLEASLASTLRLGGAIVSEPKSLGGNGTMAVIRDPAGAVIALFQPA